MAIQGDSGSALPRREQGQGLWTLPAIVALSIIRRRYLRPRRYQRAGRLIALEEGIEIVVETDDEFPARALSPVLNIGREQVTECTAIGPRRYLFAVTDEAVLREGAPIRLGWIGLPPPEGTARFSYHAPSGEAERESERRRSLLDVLRAIWRRLFGRRMS